jgi:hypothetical protein
MHDATGMGSNLHLAVNAFAKAINAGRVFVFAPRDLEPEFKYSPPERCNGTRAWECWFEPISRCTPSKKSDVYYARFYGVKGSSKKVPEQLGCDPAYREKGCPPFTESGNARYEHKVRSQGVSEDNYPTFFDDLLACSPVAPIHYPYWWKAQALSYLMRFTARTRAELDHLRPTKLLQMKQGNTQKFTPDVLPPGTLAVYVRHGEKQHYDGTNLFDWKSYYDAMEKIATNASIPVFTLDPAFEQPAFAPGIAFSSRVAVVGTEDPEVIASVGKTASVVVLTADSSPKMTN